MPVVKPSSKHQIVIPQPIRDKLGIKPGINVYIDMVGDKEARISTLSVLDRYAGTMPGMWGDDPVATLRSERDAWDKHLGLS